jgi:hypothetical protein
MPEPYDLAVTWRVPIRLYFAYNTFFFALGTAKYLVYTLMKSITAFCVVLSFLPLLT